MERFTPEFAVLWLNEAEQSAERSRADAGDFGSSLSPSQQTALEELAERVNAARSVL
jgi:hypothetical protein